VGFSAVADAATQIDIHDASVVARSVAQVVFSAVADRATQIDIHVASLGNGRPTHRPTDRPNCRPNDRPPDRPDNTSADPYHDKFPSRCTPPKISLQTDPPEHKPNKKGRQIDTPTAAEIGASN